MATVDVAGVLDDLTKGGVALQPEDVGPIVALVDLTFAAAAAASTTIPVAGAPSAPPDAADAPQPEEAQPTEEEAAKANEAADAVAKVLDQVGQGLANSLKPGDPPVAVESEAFTMIVQKAVIPKAPEPGSGPEKSSEEKAAEAAAALGAVEVIFAPAVKLQKSSVVDTTGAGDAFIGSMCYGVATGMELKDAMRLGAYVAAKKCGSLGARPGLPDISEVPEAVFQGKEKPKVAAAAVNKTASRPPAVRKAKAPREMNDIDKEFADGTRKSIAPGLSKWMLKLGRRYQ